MPSYHKPAHSKYFHGPLYDQMAEDLQLTGKAQRTVHGYLRAVRQLADHYCKSPDQISETQLRRYFLYLKNQRQAAYGTLRVALSGIQFFYRTTYPRDWNVGKKVTIHTLEELRMIVWFALGWVYWLATARDSVVDYVRHWKDRTEIPAKRLLAWIGIPQGTYYQWAQRYGKANEHNGWIHAITGWRTGRSAPSCSSIMRIRWKDTAG